MPRQKTPTYLYMVFVTSYASEEIKQAIEGGRDRIRDPQQLSTQIFYNGTSKAQAERAFSRAAIEAYANRLAIRIALQRNRE